MTQKQFELDLLFNLAEKPRLILKPEYTDNLYAWLYVVLNKDLSFIEDLPENLKTTNFYNNLEENLLYLLNTKDKISIDDFRKSTVLLNVLKLAHIQDKYCFSEKLLNSCVENNISINDIITKKHYSLNMILTSLSSNSSITNHLTKDFYDNQNFKSNFDLIIELQSNNIKKYINEESENSDQNKGFFHKSFFQISYSFLYLYLDIVLNYELINIEKATVILNQIFQYFMTSFKTSSCFELLKDLHNELKPYYLELTEDQINYCNSLLNNLNINQSLYLKFYNSSLDILKLLASSSNNLTRQDILFLTRLISTNGLTSQVINDNYSIINKFISTNPEFLLDFVNNYFCKNTGYLNSTELFIFILNKECEHDILKNKFIQKLFSKNLSNNSYSDSDILYFQKNIYIQLYDLLNKKQLIQLIELISKNDLFKGIDFKYFCNQNSLDKFKYFINEDDLFMAINNLTKDDSYYFKFDLLLNNFKEVFSIELISKLFIKNIISSNEIKKLII